VAIIVIMGYHGGVFFTSGGFYSLDMFFTQSGFLITSLLITEWHQTETIRLGVFWARRARRLLPALLVMLLAVALSNAYLVPPGTYAHLRSDGISALFYFANWHYIAIGSNYFVQTGLTSPLTHTWSLAVEEQFYLVWPLVVLGLFKLWRSKMVLLVVCVAGALASATEMALLYSPADVNRLYYGTDTRAQSLLVGASLAVALSLWSDRRRAAAVPAAPHPTSLRPGGDPAWAVSSPLGRKLIPALGLAGVLGSVALWIVLSSNNPWAYRGGFLAAALATAAVLLSVVCAQRSLLALGLSWAPLRYVGRISYGMYLWHFPLFLFLDHARTGLTGYPLFSARVVVTLAVATVSFYALERPIRQGTFLRGWTSWLVSPVAVVGVVIALFAGATTPALAARSVPAALPVPSPTSTVAPGAPWAPTAPDPASSAAGPPLRVLWVGDSTAFTLAIALSAEQRAYGVTSYDGGILGCGVTDGSEYQLQGVDAPMAPPCSGRTFTAQWPQLWLHEIAQFQPDVVIILAGRWEVVNRTYEGRWTDIEDPTYAAYVQQQLHYAVQVAGSSGAHVILMTAPCYDSGEQPNGDPWPEDSPARLSIYNGLVREVAATSPDTSLLDFNAMACPGGQYVQDIDGVQVRSADGVHFAPGGGVAFASRFWPDVLTDSGRQVVLAHDH
jgi:peptidoglycan/LPS O-acetylase OafA/YrhL